MRSACAEIHRLLGFLEGRLGLLPDVRRRSSRHVDGCRRGRPSRDGVRTERADLDGHEVRRSVLRPHVGGQLALEHRPA